MGNQFSTDIFSDQFGEVRADFTHTFTQILLDFTLEVDDFDSASGKFEQLLGVNFAQVLTHRNEGGVNHSLGKVSIVNDVFYLLKTFFIHVISVLN